MLAVFLSPPCPSPIVSSFDLARGRTKTENHTQKKTASYINASYKICSLHFWSFGSFSWSFRGCVFVIKPRCTRRENELETEKKELINTASYIYASYKFVPYISGRLSLFLDPSEAVSLSSSLDAQREKMRWRLKKKKWWKPLATYTQAIKFVSHISGRLSLVLDPSEAAVSLSSSLDAHKEKMSWSWHLSTERSARQGDATDRYVSSRVQYTFQYASIGNK